jgi:hypothetical protein
MNKRQRLIHLAIWLVLLPIALAIVVTASFYMTDQTATRSATLESPR